MSDTSRETVRDRKRVAGGEETRLSDRAGEESDDKSFATRRLYNEINTVRTSIEKKITLSDY